MKKLFSIMLTLIWMISEAMAQSPAMHNEGDSCKANRLSVEITDFYGNGFSHPEYLNGQTTCPFVQTLKMSPYYTSCLWETSLPSSETFNEDILTVSFDYSGYVKLTAWDNLGNVGSDSIWFNINDTFIPPMENLSMTIGEDWHATLKGNVPEGTNYSEVEVRRGGSTLPPGVFLPLYNSTLQAGDSLYLMDTESYDEENLWIYKVILSGECGSSRSTLIPGVLIEREGGDYLTIHSILQDESCLGFYGNKFLYLIFTIDENGEKHQLLDGNNPITLQPEITFSWQIPNEIYGYDIQFGVITINDGRLVSLSNIVSYYTDNTTEREEEILLNIFPNPTNDGNVYVVGSGIVSAFNEVGQKLWTKELKNGQENFQFSQKGCYLIKLVTNNGEEIVKKIIVQ